MLNPDTNSDSPSEKSNGVRLLSATSIINHIIIIGGNNNNIIAVLENNFSFNDLYINEIIIIKIANLIS